MRSNYKNLGQYIRQVNVRNKDDAITKLLGVNLSKNLMPSVAKTHGVDLSKYKVLSKNQFACKFMSVGRDEKLPIGFYQSDEKAIISSAYYVFEVINEKILNPEYLMMWLSRPENDRLLWFKSGGDVRGSISWEDFCEIQLPVLPNEKQLEIVSEYSALNDNVTLNKKFSHNLEEVIQTIYKQWFEDFEFPISKEYAESIGKPEFEGKPYKSSGGSMRYCEESSSDIPSNWNTGSITELVDIEDGDRGKNYPKKEEVLTHGYCLFLGAENVSHHGFKFEQNLFISKDKNEKLGGGKLLRNDVIMTTRGSAIGKLGFYSNIVPFDHMRINSGMLIFRSKNVFSSSYIYSTFKSSVFKTNLKGHLSGSAQPQLPIKDIKKIQMTIPDSSTLKEFSKFERPLQEAIDIRMLKNIHLNETLKLLLSKMSQ